MLTVWNPGRHVVDGILGSYHANFLPFDIEKYNFKSVSNIEDAQIIAVQGHGFLELSPKILYDKINLIKNLNLRPDQKLVILHIWHVDNCCPDQQTFAFARRIIQQELPNPFVIVHTNFAHNDELTYDFLWNRQKIYFTNYNYIDLSDRVYTMTADIKNFQLSRIEKHNDENKTILKKFLCPNRIYNHFEHPRLVYRNRLKKFIENYRHHGYYSDPLQNVILPCENPGTDHMLNHGGWYPVANKMYNQSFFSLYVESLVGIHDFKNPQGRFYKYRSITEKTWDPLIKGHFILPFGYVGIIEHIKSYGFQLPDWIDYSYDSIENDLYRFEAFLESAHKLMKLSIQDLTDLFERDLDMLLHNRELFWKRPYDSLHDKLIKHFNIPYDQYISKISDSSNL